MKQKKDRENGFSDYVFSSPTGGHITPEMKQDAAEKVGSFLSAAL